MLLHAVPQHLIGRDEHDADDEGHSESTDEALANARLPVVLLRMHCGQETEKQAVSWVCDVLKTTPSTSLSRKDY